MWLRNRQVRLRDRWHRLRTIRYYRGATRSRSQRLADPLPVQPGL